MTDAHDLIADKRRRTKRWMVLGVLLGAGAVAGWSALRWKRRKDAVAGCGARLATLQRCLLGGDTVPIDLHQELRARWLGQGPAGGPWPARCALEARRLVSALEDARSQGAGNLTDLRDRVETLVAALEQDGPPSAWLENQVGRVFGKDAARPLPVRPALDTPEPPTPVHPLPLAPGRLGDLAGGEGAISGEVTPLWVRQRRNCKLLPDGEQALARLSCAASSYRDGQIMEGVAGEVLIQVPLETGTAVTRLDGTVVWSGKQSEGRGGFVRGDDFAALFEPTPDQYEVVWSHGGVVTAQKLKLPKGTLETWLAHDHLLALEPGKTGPHLTARRLGHGDVAIGPVRELGPMAPSSFGVPRLCRSKDALIMAIGMGSPDGRLVWLDEGDDVPIRIEVTMPHGARLDCPGEQAVLTWLDHDKLEERRCERPARCASAALELPPDARSSALAFGAAGNDVVLVSRSSDLDLWLRRGPLPSLASSPPLYLGNGSAPDRILARGDVAVLVTMDGQLVRIAPGGPPTVLPVAP